jgi:hypothetical protein
MTNLQKNVLARIERGYEVEGCERTLLSLVKRGAIVDLQQARVEFKGDFVIRYYTARMA